MNKKINGFEQYKIENRKNIFFISKSPKIKSNLIQKKIKTQIIIDKNENILNNNNYAKIKLDKNKLISMKENYKNKNITNNEVDKNSVNDKKNNIRKIIIEKENDKISEKNNELNLIKNEDKQKIEDISDYININEIKKITSYKNIEKNIANEAIEEVEEAKEMSMLKQPSELMNHVLNSKSSIKKSDINENKTDYLKKKFYKIKSKNKSNKFFLKKRMDEEINFSSSLKSAEHNSLYNSIKKNNLKLKYIKIKNYFGDNAEKNLISPKNFGSNCVINEKKIKRNQKYQIKRKHIIKGNLNVFGLNKKNNNNKSNINMKNIKEMRDFLNNEKNDNYFINNNSISKTYRNKKIIIQKNINITERNKISTVISSESNLNGIKINNKNKKINHKGVNSKLNRHKNLIISNDKEKNLKRRINTEIYDYNYFNFDKIKSIIKKIKKSKEKYHQLFTDYLFKK